MQIYIRKSFAFRAPTRAELARDHKLFRNDPAALSCIALPRFVDEHDIHHLLWCDSGIPLLLRQLAALLPDNHSPGRRSLGEGWRADHLPPLDTTADSYINDPLVLTARFRHLFFGDIPHDLSLSSVHIQRKGKCLICRYRNKFAPSSYCNE